MQSASHGLRGAARKPGLHLLGHTPPNKSSITRQRAIHIPPPFPHAAKQSASNIGSVPRVLSQARAALGRFVAHLTAPGLGSAGISGGHALSSSSRSGMHTNAARFNAQTSIKQGMSFPARVALSRPLHAPYLPRAPACPRSLTQVGLGTARNFSTGRPIFQHLVENVPIAGRAFYEADWEVKMQDERRVMFAKMKMEERRVKKTKAMMKAKAQTIDMQALQRADENSRKEQTKSTHATEFEHYFALPSTSAVTTYLLIPLAPTPTTRTPLAEYPEPHDGHLPLPAIGAMHASHSTHALRVSALFSRLDASNVWARGVTCSAYAHGAAGGLDTDSGLGGPSGVCTVLKVEFSGWTKAEVRGVIGESGTGWCVLDEVHHSARTHSSGSASLSSYEADDDDADSVLSGMTSEVASSDNGLGLMMLMPPESELDPSRSFVLPTLDFSSSFASAAASPLPSSRGLSDYASDFDAEADVWSDIDTGSDFDSVSELSSGPVLVAPPSENGYFNFGVGFSSAFTARASSQPNPAEPREDLF
ncbi:hypothetical protein HGRIS_013633 [Hohenbuehelia grisea]|uniref:Uncharacterized protein n=1 Tax=Hohenbuehelia grisea TaxID=104357 RepID=A0ABR3IWA6_9AGAR